MAFIILSPSRPFLAVSTSNPLLLMALASGLRTVMLSSMTSALFFLPPSANVSFAPPELLELALLAVLARLENATRLLPLPLPQLEMPADMVEVPPTERRRRFSDPGDNCAASWAGSGFSKRGTLNQKTEPWGGVPPSLLSLAL